MKVYCDANVLIQALEGGEEPAKLLEAVFGAVEQKAITLVTSTLSLAETLQKPLERNDRKLVGAYAILLANDRSDFVHTIEVSRSILVDAAFVRIRKKSIKLPDAIHIATAERSGCDQILTRETRWDGATALPLIDLGPDTLGRLLGYRP